MSIFLFYLSSAGISEQKQMEIFRIVSGILHMGNVLFSDNDKDSDSCYIAVSGRRLLTLTL